MQTGSTALNRRSEDHKNGTNRIEIEQDRRAAVRSLLPARRGLHHTGIGVPKLGCAAIHTERDRDLGGLILLIRDKIEVSAGLAPVNPAQIRALSELDVVLNLNFREHIVSISMLIASTGPRS